MIVAEDNEAVGGAVEQAADIAQSAGANIRNGRRPGDAPEGTVFMSRTKSFTRRSRELPQTLRGRGMLTPSVTSLSLAEVLVTRPLPKIFDLTPWNYSVVVLR